MDYRQIPLNKRAARGRNGVFDAELIELTVEWQEPEHIPVLVVEVWSRRRAEGQAPIRFVLGTSEALVTAESLQRMTIDALQRRLHSDLGME